MQQELLRKSIELKTLPKISQFCETPESLKHQEPDNEAYVAGLSHLRLLKIPIESLCKRSHHLKHAGGSQLEIIGSYSISVQQQGKIFTTEFYFVQNVYITCLSLDTCKKIEVIHQNFPNVNVNTAINVFNTATQNQARLLHEHYTILPFEPTEEKISKLESWFLNQFSKSTFDITSQPLPPIS